MDCHIVAESFFMPAHVSPDFYGTKPTNTRVLCRWYWAQLSIYKISWIHFPIEAKTNGQLLFLFNRILEYF